MSLETIIARFGYPALVLGLLLEGETVLVLGAFLAHRGYLSLPLVIALGFLVTFGSDQFFFWMGRTRGSEYLETRPDWQPAIEKAKSLLHRNTTLPFLGFRFLYGLRTVLPFVFGLSRFSPQRFAFLNLLGALLWSLLFGLAGFAFGQVVETLIADVEKYELWIALGLVLAGAGVWLYRRHARRQS